MADLVIQGVPVVAESILTYNTVAATMFTFWDYLLTFGDEVDLIWRSKLTWVNILFYVIRYLTFFIRIVHLVFCTNAFGMVDITPSGCLLWQWFQNLSGQFLFLAVEVLLITRVYAFYGRNKILLAALLFLLAAELAALLTLVTLSLQTDRIFINPLSNIHAGPCIGISISGKYDSLWAPPVIMQSILSILVAWKFVKTRMHAQRTSPPLLTVFVRDHTWAFVLILAVSLWSVLAYQLTLHQGEIALTWNYSVLGFCGSHLILNLRSAARNASRSGATLDVSEIKFGQNAKVGPGAVFSTVVEGWAEEGSRRDVSV